jgi:glycosyltransferase involved in cell wall biosynthesis
VFERDYWGTSLVAAQCRVPCALFLHHAGLNRTNRFMLPWIRRRFLLPSENLRRWLISRGVSACNTDVLYNPVDTKHFSPNAALREETRARLGIAADEILVGYIGRLESNKGILPFANALTTAMDRVPKLRALWVGFGRREAELDAYIQGTPYANRHLRRAWTEEMLPYYSAMDMVALPSTGREAFGRVLIEAQSCAIPVLGSDIGGIAETMDVGITGKLVAPGDSAAWADALTELALDPEARRTMGEAGRAFVRNTFDSCRIATAFEKLLSTTPH